MRTQSKSIFSKETLFIEWVFFCAYWGFYAIAWHFATLVKDGNDYVLYDIGIYLHFVALVFYIIGAILVFDRHGIISSQSQEPSDKQHQTQA